jgi:hypothetical protein
MALSKADILGISDIEIKEIHVPVWDADIFIKQLTRGQQDAYLKRQFGKFGVKQTGKQQNIESNMDMFGHDAWLFVQGVCDENGKRIFSDSEVGQIEAKNGEAVGFVASEIVKFSGMDADIEELEKVKN